MPGAAPGRHYSRRMGEQLPLSDEEFAAMPASLPRWSLVDGSLVRTVTADSFRQAVGWVAAVADAAEDANHHPDMDIRFRSVTFRLRTHDVDALSAADVDLARRIDGVVELP